MSSDQTCASCLNVESKPKERFVSEAQARRVYHRKRRFQHCRFPTFYRCECGWYHATRGNR